MSKLAAALALAAKGFKVFPIKPGAKAPPLWKNWPERATSDPAQINWPERCNVGVHCDGLVVLDIDVKKQGFESLLDLEIKNELTQTYTVRTPSGGLHLYYRSAVAVPNGVDSLGPGIDTRSRNGYVLAHGSETAAGRYSVEQDIDIADAPEWLVQRLGTFAKREAPQNLNVPDAPDEAVKRAEAWLVQQPPAIEGQGGDAHTFAVICGRATDCRLEQRLFATVDA